MDVACVFSGSSVLGEYDPEPFGAGVCDQLRRLLRRHGIPRPSSSHPPGSGTAATPVRSPFL